MGATADILRSYARPLAPIREHLARGPVESRSLAFLMVGCIVVFVAQWPQLARVAQLEGEPFDRLVAYSLLAWLFFAPLLLYGLALLGHGVSRLLGGRGTSAEARLALFWAWLTATPLAMLTGILSALTGNSLPTNAAGALWIGAFLAFWALNQREAGRGAHA